MENQHRKIKGYRELGKEEIDLMNRIKSKGSELLALEEELRGRLWVDREKLFEALTNATPETEQAATEEFARFNAAEPTRWAAMGKTNIQTGIMALVRAVAQPTEI